MFSLSESRNPKSPRSYNLNGKIHFSKENISFCFVNPLNDRRGATIKLFFSFKEFLLPSNLPQICNCIDNWELRIE